MMGVIICHRIKESNPAVVTGKNGIKGVVKFQCGIQTIAGTFKNRT